ncbi:MAG: M20/M25/M40 family metallo-hydrolase [Acidimicrobiales bacterium]
MGDPVDHDALLDHDALAAHIEGTWQRDVLPTLSEYTTVKCLSPAYAPDWAETGELRRAASLLADWCSARPIPGLAVEVDEAPGLTPTLVVDAPAVGAAGGAVVVYGHLDKQPPQGAWREGLGPYRPVHEGDLLFGRGTADDGYSVFAALSALEALAALGAERPRVLVLIEGSEESGSPHLAEYLTRLAPRIGRPDLVVCLDSGCLTYDRLWLTDSLRGNLTADVGVEVLTEGMHSGLAGGVVPSSFRLLRRLLSRLEDERTGDIVLPELGAPVPPRHRANLEAVAAEFPDALGGELPTVPGLVLEQSSEAERLVARAWAPALAVTGMAGIPAPADAGNVLRPYTEAKVSLRLPPTVDATAAGAALVRILTADPPSGSRVTVTLDTCADGWVAPDPEPWVAAALARASLGSFGVPPSSYGEGGTIPFLAELGRRYPGTPLVATGVLGPGSNAHGPNEALHLPMARAVSAAVAHLVVAVPHRP